MPVTLTRRQALIALGLFAFALVFLLTSGHAFAEDAPVPPVIPNDSTATVAPWIYSLIAGLATPLLTGLITKVTATSPVKAVINAALVAVSAIVGQIILGNGSFAVQNTIVLAVTIFVVNVASYFGLWKPALGPNALAPNAGIGPKQDTNLGGINNPPNG